MPSGSLAVIWQEPFLILYLLVVVASLWKYPRYYDTPLRYLPILLMYTLLTEVMGVIIRDDPNFSINLSEFYYNNNWLIFNIYNLIFFLYFGYVYGLYLTGSVWKKTARAGLVLFIAASLINAFMEDFRVFSQLYAYTVGGILMIVLAWAYLRQQYRLRQRIPLHSNLLVWISLGILVFYMGYLPIKYIRSLAAKLELVSMPELIRPLHLGLILFMYGCFLMGLLRLHRMKKPGL